jgi:hypothetical protein
MTKVLTLNASGQKVEVDIPIGDMLKSIYDTNNNGIVDTATQVVFEVVLQESVTIGDPIYVTTPSPTQIFVGRARQDTPSKMPCIGLALATANGGSTIKAVNIGGVFGMNTNGLTNGQALYVAPTGGYTTTKPSTRVQNIGLVGRVGGGDGIIIASVMNMQDDITSGIVISGNSILNFDGEQDKAINTIANTSITLAGIKSISFIPIETTETSIDDFTLNGVDFKVVNVIDNLSFDIIGSAVNNASGNYTVEYIITI